MTEEEFENAQPGDIIVGNTSGLPYIIREKSNQREEVLATSITGNTEWKKRTQVKTIRRYIRNLTQTIISAKEEAINTLYRRGRIGQEEAERMMDKMRQEEEHRGVKKKKKTDATPMQLLEQERLRAREKQRLKLEALKATREPDGYDRGW